MAEEQTPDVVVTLHGAGRASATHAATGHVLETDMSPRYGGGGSTFSSTDLVAAALGTCIASSIDTILERAGIDLDGVVITVTKTLTEAPKRIGNLHVVISIAHHATERLTATVERAAATCTVHRSLNSHVEVHVEFR